ncbi:MAG: transcriptional regulator [Nitriliruptorales bacterium]|nr:transcriptional regulator [Nitriliruptorales bacterium]
MGRTNFAAMNCSIARTLEVIGERWSLLIVRDAFYGVRRFDDFQRDLGIARNVLTDRLATLVEWGVFDRRQYEDRPPRFEYVLTEKGRELLPVILTMMRWGDRWESGGDRPVTLTHRACGHVAEPVVACSHCRGDLLWKELRTDPIPVTLPARG